jgi:hypothetical protein
MADQAIAHAADILLNFHLSCHFPERARPSRRRSGVQRNMFAEGFLMTKAAS